jgi:integrase
MEVRSVRLQDLDFDREQLKVVQGKDKKTATFLIKTFNSRTQNLHWSRKKTYLFNGQPQGIAGDFLIVIPNVVQWAVKQASKAAGITEVCVHTLAHLLRIYSKTDSILSRLKSLGTWKYRDDDGLFAHCATRHHKAFSPLDTLFAKCTK